MRKERYETAELEVIRFTVTDTILQSPDYASPQNPANPNPDQQEVPVL